MASRVGVVTITSIGIWLVPGIHGAVGVCSPLRGLGVAASLAEIPLYSCNLSLRLGDLSGCCAIVGPLLDGGKDGLTDSQFVSKVVQVEGRGSRSGGAGRHFVDG